MSQSFARSARSPQPDLGTFGFLAPEAVAQLTPDWVWGGSTGRGVRVAVIDSGIEYDHPALGGSVRGGVLIEYDDEAETGVRAEPDDRPRDPVGHGTACAGIIHALAPEAELYSVRVLGKDLRGRAVQFAGGLAWAMEHGMHVANVSLSASRQEYYAVFHQLADDAYLKNMVFVIAANNLPLPSYPSLYASIISVAAHQTRDPYGYYYNPSPTVEFGAPGVDIRVAWNNKQYGTCTGNSFAAPHIAGLAALIRGKHPDLNPFQIKTVLWACAANAREKTL